MRWAISAGVWARAAALALAWLSTGLLWSAPLQAATRGVALVVGNGAYAERPLTNTANDARDMAALLREAGFEVMLKTDVEEAALKEALAEFEDQLRRTRGVGLFYFAGHGTQTARGRNYLLPVGRVWRRERDVELFGVAAAEVLASMERANGALNIVILDACRDAPLPTEERSVASRGLARMDAPSGSLIAYATAPGRTASDNPGQRNGLYTSHLLRAMRTPGLRLEDVFKIVGRDVERSSGGAQSPEEFMKLRDPTPFCFFGASDGRCGLAPDVQVANLPPAVPALPTPERRPPPLLEKVTFAADVFFDAGRATLSDLARTKLDDLVDKSAKVALEVVIAVGHAAPDEGPDTLGLTRRRLDAVRAYLKSRGIDARSIYTEPKAATQPVADNRSAEGRAKNRRVEIEVVGTRSTQSATTTR